MDMIYGQCVVKKVKANLKMCIGLRFGDSKIAQEWAQQLQTISLSADSAITSHILLLPWRRQNVSDVTFSDFPIIGA